TTAPPPPPDFPLELKGLICAGAGGDAVSGDVVSVSKDGTNQIFSRAAEVDYAYRLHAGLAVQVGQSVEIEAFGKAHTLGDLTLVGAGVYQGHSGAILLVAKPDVLHDNAKFVRLYDLATGNVIGTQLSIAPGSKLDRVSIAGDLFVMSGASAEGG